MFDVAKNNRINKSKLNNMAVYSYGVMEGCPNKYEHLRWLHHRERERDREREIERKREKGGEKEMLTTGNYGSNRRKAFT